MFSLNDYHYDLPSELIAQQPAAQRDRSNLLHLDRQTGGPGPARGLERLVERSLDHPEAVVALGVVVLRERLRPAQLEEMSQGWRPWRAYAALLLWSSAPGSGG